MKTAVLIGGPADGRRMPTNGVSMIHVPYVRYAVESFLPADFEPESGPEYTVEVYYFHEERDGFIYYVHSSLRGDVSLAARLEVEAMDWPEGLPG